MASGQCRSPVNRWLVKKLLRGSRFLFFTLSDSLAFSPYQTATHQMCHAVPVNCLKENRINALLSVRAGQPSPHFDATPCDAGAR
jgi:hypothetical protein